LHQISQNRDQIETRDGKNTRARGYPQKKSVTDSDSIILSCTRGYPLPVTRKKLKLKLKSYFIKLNLIKIKINSIFYYVKFNYNLI